MNYRHQNQQDTAKTILDHVADTLDISSEAMTSNKRIRPLVEARMIYCLICREHAPFSIIVETIGEVIKRDHSSVTYNIREGRNLLVNKAFAEKFSRVLETYKTKVLLEFDHYNHIPQY